MQGNRMSMQAHVGPEQKIEVRRAVSDKSPLVEIERLQIFFDDDATARKLAEAILAILPVDEKAHVCALPESVNEALNSGDGAYRP